MSFTSIGFLLFMPAVFLLYHAVPLRYRYAVLALADGLFILCFGIKSALILAAVILITYAGGMLTERAKAHRKAVFFLFLILTLLVFLLFKYRPGSFGAWSVVGLSFYTLQAVGYLIDVYLERVSAEKDPVRYASFIAFFPTVVSGPIQRSTGLLEKIRNGTEFSYDLAKSGALMMLAGYFEKILIADRIHVLIEPVFSDVSSRTGATLLFGCLMYGIELYADFAGYSLIALGAARLLGFRLDDNFRQPYFAVSIKDFWRRWHVSLSEWLRDYIYIPLGGNRKGTARKYLNLMITFFVSGLWHGNGFKYIAWGLYHGACQVIGSLFGSGSHSEAKKTDRAEHRIACPRILKCIITFLLVDLGWIFFRADSLRDVFVILKKIFLHFQFADSLREAAFLCGFSPKRFGILLAETVLLFLFDLLREKNINPKGILDKRPVALRWAVYLIITVAVIIGAVYNFGLDASAFIYAQF